MEHYNKQYHDNKQYHGYIIYNNVGITMPNIDWFKEKYGFDPNKHMKFKYKNNFCVNFLTELNDILKFNFKQIAEI